MRFLQILKGLARGRRALLRGALSSLAVLAGLSFTAGCSYFKGLVFEDRTDCPTWLRIKADPALDTGTWPGMPLLVTFDGRDSVYADVQTKDVNDGYVLALKKGNVEVVGLSGWYDHSAEVLEDRDALFLVPYGEQCPQAVGAHESMSLPVETELYDMPLRMKGLSLLIRFTFTGAAEGYVFKPTVEGGVDGFTFPDLSLHYGSFRADADYVDYYHRNVRVPRQVDPFGPSGKAGDGGLGLMVVFSICFPGTSEWRPFYNLEMSGLFEECGYDWDRRILEDVEFRFDMADGALTMLEVQIGDWTKVIIGEGGTYVI